MDRQCAPFPEGEESEHVIQIRVGQEDSGDRSAANRTPGAEKGAGFDLNAYIGGRIKQEPSVSVRADGRARLSAGGRARGNRSRRLARRAPAVPLGKSASGGGAH